MRSKFNELTGLYEQVSDDLNQPAVDTDETAQEETVEGTPVEGTDTGKLHAFVVNSSNIDAINQIASGQSNEWKSETPLKVLGKDGTIGADAMLNGKPLYLMIKTYKSKSDRASSDAQLELNDRVYLLLNTSANELSSTIEDANGIDERINFSVKAPDGTENTVAIWSDNIDATPTDDATLNTDSANVAVNMQAQIENPGTAAGISGTIEENNIYMMNEKSEAINEQLALVGSMIWNSLSPEVKKTAKAGLKKVVNTGKKVTNTMLSNILDPLGVNKMVMKYLSPKSTGNKVSAFGAMKEIAKKAGIATNAAGRAAGTAAKAKSKSRGTRTPGAFATQEEGDAFRTWANSTPELAAKYGKTSSFDLDATGKFNNSFINKAYAAAKVEYTASKDAAAKEKTFKYKEGDIVYYKITPEGNVKTVDPSEVGTDVATIDKQKKEMKTDNIQNSKYGTGANPHITEAIVTSFARYKQITEDDDLATELSSEDVDKEAGLIKDFKDGNIKKGKVIKQVDDENIQLVNIKSEKEATVKVSDLISKEDAKKAALKIKEEREAKEKADAEAKKSDVEGAKDDLSTARDGKKDAKKKLRDTKKTKRKKKRTDKVNKKTEKIKKKTDEVNTSESVVYSFDDFIKKTNDLS